MRPYSLNEVADWIMTKRRKDAFKDWTHEQIVNFLADHFSKIVLEQDDSGITAVIVAHYDHTEKYVYVLAILGPPGLLRRLINLTKEHYPGWEVWGARKNKGYVRYDLLWTKDHKARAPQGVSCTTSSSPISPA